MNYKETLDIVECRIETYLQQVLESDTYRSIKAEEYLRTFCEVRKYLKEKIKEESEVKNEG